MSHLRLPARIGPGPPSSCSPARAAADPPPKLDLDELAPHPDLEWLRRAKVPTDDAGLVKFLDGLRGPEPDLASSSAWSPNCKPGRRPSRTRPRRGWPRSGQSPSRSCGGTGSDRTRRPPAGSGPAWRRSRRPRTGPWPGQCRLVRRTPPGRPRPYSGTRRLRSTRTPSWTPGTGWTNWPRRTQRRWPSWPAAWRTSSRPGGRWRRASSAGGGRGPEAGGGRAAQGPHAVVRLRAAQGLLAGKDTAGVPVLIDLLADAGVEVRWQAEELLRWLAVDAAPEAVVGADAKLAAAGQTGVAGVVEGSRGEGERGGGRNGSRGGRCCSWPTTGRGAGRGWLAATG